VRRKPEMPAFMLANRWGCFAVAAVLAVLIGVAAYIGLSAPSGNMQNSVIPTAPESSKG
jgi:hypothetical protein